MSPPPNVPNPACSLLRFPGCRCEGTRPQCTLPDGNHLTAKLGPPSELPHFHRIEELKGPWGPAQLGARLPKKKKKPKKAGWVAAQPCLKPSEEGSPFFPPSSTQATPGLPFLPREYFWLPRCLVPPSTKKRGQRGSLGSSGAIPGFCGKRPVLKREAAGSRPGAASNPQSPPRAFRKLWWVWL